MDDFQYQNGQLMAESIPCESLAKQWGTPLFVYSKKTLMRHWQAFKTPLQGQAHTICFAVKATPNIAILQQLAQMGAGFDVVSIGELERARLAGADPKTIVFAGVGKQAHEIERAIALGIKCFNVESSQELALINDIAENMGQQAPIALRLNPNVDPKTHPYIATGMKHNKFGIPIERALSLYQQVQDMPGLKIQGIACHIGSQLTTLEPFVEAMQALLQVIDTLADHGIHVHHIDMGGGLGVPYQDETPPSPQTYVDALRDCLGDRDLELIIEPGRAITANAGILLCRTLLLKDQGEKHFAIVDAAMNDLLRPALYEAHHEIVPVIASTKATQRYDIVGPVCESGDCLGKNRLLNVQAGDLLAVRTVGAYGASMSSQYNSRPRAAEVLVDGAQVHLIREREQLHDLTQHERLIDDSFHKNANPGE